MLAALRAAQVAHLETPLALKVSEMKAKGDGLEQEKGKDYMYVRKLFCI